MINKRHIANLITITRILGIVLIFWLTPYQNNFWLLVVAEIYTLICVSDFLDGWVARKLKIESYVGKVLDPFADKLVVLIFLPLLEMQVITSFPVFIILAREFAIMALRIVAAKEETTIVAAQFSGKLKTLITMPVCGILLGRVPVTEVVQLPWILQPFEWLRLWIVTWPNYIINILIYTVVFVTLWSFFAYFNTFIWQQYIAKFNGDEEKARRTLRSLIPNAFSLSNLLCGLASIPIVWFGHLETAVLFIMLGIIFDAFDGTLARRLDAYSKFGEKLDTKADFMTFGIAPAFLIYVVLYSTPLPYAQMVAVGLGLLYAGSVYYRLRRFGQTGHSELFDGLPSPLGAGVVVLSSVSIYLQKESVFIGIILISIVLMISRLPCPHQSALRNSAIGRAFRKMVMVFLIITLLNLTGLEEASYFYPYEALVVLAAAYSLAPIWKWSRGRK